MTVDVDVVRRNSLLIGYVTLWLVVLAVLDLAGVA